jgi:glyoxylase-like metal-dependent hydrolase (beta-lactamase superfamily II)
MRALGRAQREVLLATLGVAAPLLSIAATAFATGDSTDGTALDRLVIARDVVYYRPHTAMGNQSSIAVAGDDAVLLIDANVDVVLPAILQDIDTTFGVTLKYIVTSHHHGDHTQGLEQIGCDVVTIAPITQRALLETTPLTSDDSPPLDTAALPTLTFSDSISIHLGGVVAEILTPPFKNSHTGGDAFVYLRDRGVLYVGDHYFYERFPIIDFDGGGDLDGFLGNLLWIETTFPESTLIIPGHGSFRPTEPVAPTMKDFSAWRARIVKSIELMKDAARQGMTLDEVIARGLGEEYAAMSTRPRYLSEERWIRQIYPQLIEN